MKNTEEKPQPAVDLPSATSPEEVRQWVRLITRNALAVVIVMVALGAVWQRNIWFPGHLWQNAPLADHLPLPQNVIQTITTEVSALNPHESIFTIRRIVPHTVNRPAQPTAAPRTQKIDWKNTPITSAIPGAYIVVYLSHQVVGLVVDGQYIRTYYHIGLPADKKNPRRGSEARVPVGNYFVVAHALPRNQMKLRLSYPSPADAAQALAGGKITAAENERIANAAKNRRLPAKIPAYFGAPVYISGDNRPGLVTNGDIAITPKEMLELWTAVSDGAVVMIRP